MRRKFYLWLCLLAVSRTAALAADEEAARVRQVIGTASAPPHAVLQAGMDFRTGANSKSELGFRRGLVRVGEKADLQALPKGVVLRKGVTLVASEPGAMRSAIEVRAPGYHLRVRGTAQVAFDPGRSLKVVALEGELTIALDSLTGESEMLKPGQMLIIVPGDARLPEPVELDLSRLLATSGLVGGRFDALPTATRISAAAAGQAGALAKGTLTNTSLLLRGLDNSIQVDNARLGEAVAAAPPGHKPNQPKLTVAQIELRQRPGLSNPEFVAAGKSFTFDDDTNHASSIVDFTFARNGSNISRTQLLTVELTKGYETPPMLGGAVTVTADMFGKTNRELRFIQINPDDAAFRLQIMPESKIFTPAMVGLSFQPLYGIDASGAALQAGTGTSNTEFLELLPASGGMTIEGSTLIGGRVHIEGGIGRNTVELASSKVRSTGTLEIGATNSKSAVLVRDSSELRSLAANVTILSQHAPITLDKALLAAQKGTITVDAYQDATDNEVGQLMVQNFTSMTARAIRLRGYAGGGDALVIDNATLAASMIKLFAEGASTLRFKNNVTLKTPVAVLAGQTVQVDSGGAVKISGKARIYTDSAQFNKSGFGTLEAKGGTTQKGFSARESF